MWMINPPLIILPLNCSHYCSHLQAGRENDWVNPETRAPADGDKMFAANVGIGFKTPEDLFG